MDLKALEIKLKDNKNIQDQGPMERYMKNKFPFLGIKSQKRRDLSKDFIKAHRDSLDWTLVFSLWEMEEREFQYVALDYIKDRKKFIAGQDIDNFRALIGEKSWWDSVDNLSPLLGLAVNKNENGKNIMLAWSNDQNFWIRRAAILHQLKFKEDTDKELLEAIIKNNLGSKEFFINKAIGWILREYSKTKKGWVKDFIEDNKSQLNSLSIREGAKYL